MQRTTARTGWIRVSTPTEISTAPTTGMSFRLRLRDGEGLDRIRRGRRSRPGRRGGSSAQPDGRLVRVRARADRSGVAGARPAGLRLRVEARERSLPTPGRRADLG